jgi:hypothetical protein
MIDSQTDNIGEDIEIVAAMFRADGEPTAGQKDAAARVVVRTLMDMMSVAASLRRIANAQERLAAQKEGVSTIVYERPGGAGSGGPA